MSTLSNLLIDLKTSKDFVRLSIVLHAWACIALYITCDNFIICFIATCLSLWMIKKILCYQKPYSDICALLYARQVWMLIDLSGAFKVYSGLHVCLDAGFFTLLKFSGESQRRYMLIFHDQLSEKSLKMLYVLANIRKNTKNIPDPN